MTALESGADRDSRDRILDAARMRFAQDGFAGASVREIAADAGVAKPMVFYYFGNKDELFRAVVDTSVAELNSRYRASLDGAPTARAALNAFAHAHLDVAEGLSEHVQFLARCVLTVGSEFGEAMRRDHLEVIDELLDRMAADGVT
ncbi:MAG: helix-turn-helix domain-containing protein, partial [Myxococcota bacterium]